MARPITRFCFLRLRDGEDRAAIAAHLRDRIRAEGVAVEVGLPADDSALKWDVSVVFRCAELAALDALLARPTMAALLGDWLAARAVVVKTWSFEEV